MNIIEFKKNDKRFIYFFASISGILSFVENFLPRIFIFFKIGIGNIPILLIFEELSNKQLFLIMFFKTVISLFFSGLLFSPTALMSFSGNIAAFLVMVILKKVKWITIVTKSIVIAYFSNLLQLLIYAVVIINDISVISIIYVIFILSITTGFITGFIAMNIKKKYLKIKIL